MRRRGEGGRGGEGRRWERKEERGRREGIGTAREGGERDGMSEKYITFLKRDSWLVGQ